MLFDRAGGKEIPMSYLESSRTRSTILYRPMLTILLAIMTVIPSAIALAAADPPRTPDKTVKDEAALGQEAAKQLTDDKTTKWVTDPAQLARVQRIGDTIAKIAKVKFVASGYGNPGLADFSYSFRIIDDKDVNAFSLPGGFVYVNKGLMDYVQSDDELAGVIAHEISHVSHHHAMQLMKEQNKQMVAMAVALLAAAAAGGKGDALGNVAYAASLLSTARLNGYGQKAEFDADHTAVYYLVDSGYNPVGMLTFMERLARDEARKEQVDWGIYATHPPSTQRASRIISELDGLHIAINRRLVTTYMSVAVKPVPNTSAYAVWVTNTEIARLADSGGQSASARAGDMADRLGKALLAGANLHNVRLDAERRSVTVMGSTVFEPTDADAALARTSPQAVAESACKAIQRALFNESLQMRY